MNYADPRSERLSTLYASSPQVKSHSGHELEEMFSDLAGAIRRHVPLVVSGVAAGLIIAGAYVAVRTPVYRATATLMIDPARPNVLASQQVTELPMVDSGFVDSATEIINADFIAQDVVSRLKLGNDETFARPSGVKALLARLVGGGDKSSDQREADAAAAAYLSSNLVAKRVGVSYVIEVTFVAQQPETAARIANAVVDSYIGTQAKARVDAALRASNWLSVRTDELRSKVAEADTAVQQYRSANNMEETEGKLPVEQQLSELTTKLSAARGQATEAHVIADQVASLIAQGNIDSAAIAAPADSSVRQARDKLIKLASRELSVVERVGKQHQLALDANRDTQAAKQELTREVSSYEASLQKSAQAADASVRELQDQINQISANKSQFEGKAIALRELQRNADSFRQLYETFMSRQKEVSQQQSFASQDIRVASEAKPPVRPANKPLSLIFASAMGLGLFAGLSGALLRDRLDRRARSLADIEEATERRVIATVSRINGASPLDLLRRVVTHPFDLFSENFRHMRIALLGDNKPGPTVIGMSSALPGEGTTTIVSNFGQYLATSGVKALVVDCNLRKPTLTKSLCPDAEAGLLDCLSGKRDWRELLQADSTTGFTLLPGATRSTDGNPAELLATVAFADLLHELGRSFDVILLDIASFNSLYDARAVAPHVDKFVEIVRWNETRRNDIQEALVTAPEVHDKLAGVVFNMVDLKQFRRFGKTRVADMGRTG